MQFLADENFRLDVVHFLQKQGHDVKLSQRGSDDKDFSITLQFPPKNFSGILIFRIHPPRFEKYVLSIKNFLDSRRSTQIKGKTFLIEEYSFIEII